MSKSGSTFYKHDVVMHAAADLSTDGWADVLRQVHEFATPLWTGLAENQQLSEADVQGLFNRVMAFLLEVRNPHGTTFIGTLRVQLQEPHS